MGGFVLYLGCGGLGLRTPGLYQFSNFWIAKTIRPETVPARMSAANCSILLACAVGFRLRRFFFFAAIGSTPFPLGWFYYTLLCVYSQSAIYTNLRVYSLVKMYTLQRVYCVVEYTLKGGHGNGYQLPKGV